MDKKKSQAAEVKLNTDSKSGLYEWCIEEKFEDEKSTNEYIPFDYSLNFVARNIIYRQSIANEHSPFNYKSGLDLLNSRLISKKGVEFYERIQAELEVDDDFIPISFFGSKQDIKNITLTIHKMSPSDKSKERCSVYAYKDSEQENSRTLLTYIEPAALAFDVFLREAVFKNLGNRIATESIGTMAFDVNNVPGFYSNWSPTGYPDLIKLLGIEDSLELEKNIKPGYKNKAQFKKILKLNTIAGRPTCEFILHFKNEINNSVKSDKFLADNIDEESFDSEETENKTLTMEDIKFLSVTHFKKLEVIQYLLIFISFILIVFLFFK